MTNDGYEQLSAVAGLTREQEGISLTHAAIRSLRALSPGVNVAILEVHGHRRTGLKGVDLAAGDISVRRFDETGQRVAKREQVADLLDVIQRLQPTAVDSETHGTGRLIIPLAADVGPMRMVVLDDIPIDPWLRAKVMQVVEIYGNLIRLMDSRERDALTGLLNRQTFATLFELAVQRAMEAGYLTLAVAILDIDRFKRVNDTFGHLYGDEVLIHFARLMERSFRYTDDLFRFGGEEFVVLLSTPEAAQTGGVLERFRQRVEAYEFPGVGRVTVSIGFVTSQTGILPTTLIDCADRALYVAKESGRNRVVNYADISVQAAAENGVVDLF
ncbi:MAG: GGDEF domain-containing protein [Gammaproteobacteria bacterium]|nr:GGDEF domain-containing protein [Gammaproteobacteria bacterium]MCP5298734.1 GGDEF domain-containing protein [Chromatiaceae bacterium]